MYNYKHKQRGINHENKLSIRNFNSQKNESSKNPGTVVGHIHEPK